MFKYLKTTKSLLSAVVAIAAGFVSAKYLVQGNPLVSLPWGVLAFFSAFLAISKREALVLGSIIGFIASYSYLWFDNTGKFTLTKVLILIVLIILPAMFGLLCGLICSWLGWLVKNHMFKPKRSN